MVAMMLNAPTVALAELNVLMSGGFGNAEIAARLKVSRATVKGHITVALRRLGLRDRTQLAIYVHRAARPDADREAGPLEGWFLRRDTAGRVNFRCCCECGDSLLTRPASSALTSPRPGIRTGSAEYSPIPPPSLVLAGGRMTHDDDRSGLRSTPLPRGPDSTTGHVPRPRDADTRAESSRTVPVIRARTKPPTSLVRVLLCEDQEVFRVGLRVVLEAQPDMAVVAETTHLPAAVSAAGAGMQVAVVRQSLVGCATLPLLRELCRSGTAVLVLAETGEEAGSELVDVLQAGVRGFLPRRSAAQRLVDGVRSLAKNEAALDSAATNQLVHYLTSPSPQRSSRMRALDRLTERQREVAELVAQGLSNDEIAAKLFLSLATIKSHLTASMRRLGVRTRTQLAILVNRDQAPVA